MRKVRRLNQFSSASSYENQNDRVHTQSASARHARLGGWSREQPIGIAAPYRLTPTPAAIGAPQLAQPDPNTLSALRQLNRRPPGGHQRPCGRTRARAGSRCWRAWVKRWTSWSGCPAASSSSTSAALQESMRVRAFRFSRAQGTKSIASASGALVETSLAAAISRRWGRSVFE